jgi:hypothetical protein
MRQDITVTRGDTRTLTVTITDSAGDPYDLTDAAITFTVDDLFDAKTIGSGIVVNTPASGVFTITIDPADTTDAPDARVAYPYDIELVLSDGSVKTPQRGLFIVLPDVTE